MRPVVLEGAPFSTRWGWRRCPFCVPAQGVRGSGWLLGDEALLEILLAFGVLWIAP